MSKKINCDYIELKFFVPTGEVRSYSGSGTERHPKGSPRSISHASERARELGKKIMHAFGDYEKALKTFDVCPDMEAVCEHCGRAWTEDSAVYNGGCCDKDEESNPEAVSVGA